MPADDTGALARDAINVLVVAGGPVLVAMLLVGLVVGVAQAVTQINDPAVSFLPRLAALGIMIALGGSLLVDNLARFFTSCVAHMAGVGP